MISINSSITSRMKKSTLIFISSFTILFSVYLVVIVYFQPSIKSELLRIYQSFIPEKKSEPAPISTIDFPKNELPPTELTPYNGRLQKDRYEDHLSAASSNGLDLIKNEYELFSLVFEQKLVKADSGKGYRVDDLTYSFPFFTPDSKNILEQIGLAYEGLAGEGSFFTVSSATRTEEQQKALKRRNRNATDGESSHSFGISFDISYIRFNGERGWDAKAQRNLETVLNHFQQTGKIYVIKERKQSCYHVTVR